MNKKSITVPGAIIFHFLRRNYNIRIITVYMKHCRFYYCYIFSKLGYGPHLYYWSMYVIYESVIFIPFSYKNHVPNKRLSVNMFNNIFFILYAITLTAIYCHKQRYFCIEKRNNCVTVFGMDWLVCINKTWYLQSMLYRKCEIKLIIKNCCFI